MKREYIKGDLHRQYNVYCDDAVGSGVLIGGQDKRRGSRNASSKVWSFERRSFQEFHVNGAYPFQGPLNTHQALRSDTENSRADAPRCTRRSYLEDVKQCNHGS